MKFIFVFLILLFSSVVSAHQVCDNQFNKAFLQCKNSYVPETLCPTEYDIAASQCRTNYHKSINRIINDYGFKRIQSYCPKMNLKHCEKTYTSAACVPLISKCIEASFAARNGLTLKDNCPQTYKNFTAACMKDKYTKDQVTIEMFQDRCPNIYAQAVAAKKKCELNPGKASSGGKWSGACGDCKLKESVKPGEEWSRFNGYDAFLKNAFVAHVRDPKYCKDSAKIRAKCNMEDPAEDEVEVEPACVWGAGKKVFYYSVPECKTDSRALCMGQITCADKGKKKLVNVVCAVDEKTGVCPDAETCLADKTFSVIPPEKADPTATPAAATCTSEGSGESDPTQCSSTLN